MSTPWRLILAHLRHTKLRTLLTVASVMVAIFLFCLVRTVVTSLSRSTEGASAQRLVTESAVSLFVNLPIAMYPKIAAMDGVGAVTHWTWFGGVYKDERNFFARFATDVPALRVIYGDRRTGAGGRPIAGDMNLTPEEWTAFESDLQGCVVGRALAAKYGFRIGDAVPLLGNIFPGVYRLNVRGIYTSNVPSFDENSLFFHWKHLQEKSGTNTVSVYICDLADASRSGDVAAAIDAGFENSSNRTRTLSEKAFQAQFVSMWGRVDLLFTAIAAVVLFATFMITLNTALLSARERVADVGVLKTLGFTSGSILALTLAEGLVICLIGGALAVALCWPLGDALSWYVRTMLPDFVILPETKALGATLSGVIGLLSGLAPAVMASRLTIVEALRRTA